MVIDFDLRKSVKATGQGHGSDARYMMKPVLRMIASSEAGDMQGTASDGGVICLYPTGTPLDGNDECEASAASGVGKDSTFKIAFIPAGTYSLRIFRNGTVLKDLTAIKVQNKSTTTLEGL